MRERGEIHFVLDYLKKRNFSYEKMGQYGLNQKILVMRKIESLLRVMVTTHIF